MLAVLLVEAVACEYRIQRFTFVVPYSIVDNSLTSRVLLCDLQRGVQFAETSTRSRQVIAQLGASFIRNEATVLTHGYSRVVLALLQKAAAQGCNFTVVVTEGRPDATGVKMAKALTELNIPAKLVLDSGVAYMLDK